MFYIYVHNIQAMKLKIYAMSLKSLNNLTRKIMIMIMPNASSSIVVFEVIKPYKWILSNSK